MIKIEKDHCSHIFGIAIDKEHYGAYIDDDFLMNGNRPGVKGNTHYKDINILKWLDEKNTDMFIYCPRCGSKLNPAKVKERFELIGEVKPHYLKKLEDITAEHNDKELNPGNWNK